MEFRRQETLAVQPSGLKFAESDKNRIFVKNKHYAIGVRLLKPTVMKLHRTLSLLGKNNWSLSACGR